MVVYWLERSTCEAACSILGRDVKRGQNVEIETETEATDRRQNKHVNNKRRHGNGNYSTQSICHQSVTEIP